MLQNIKACLFDLDGTVVDSMWVWGNIDKEYLERFGHKVPPEMGKAIEGSSAREVAVYFQNRFGIKDSVEKIVSDWDEMAIYKYSNEVFLKPGIKEFIKYLKENDIKMGICTSNSRTLAEACLKANGIFDYFDAMSFGCSDIKGKPEPDIYLQTAEMIGVLPENCLVFEDLCKGIMAGKNAGMRTCAVMDDYSMYQWDEKISLADYFISDYFEVLNR